MKFTPRVVVLSVVLALSALAGCGDKDKAEQAHATQKMPPTIVDVQVIALGEIPISQTFSGRIVAFETSEVRPQVSGIIDEILFQEGSMVQAGQPLYRINIDNYTSSVSANEASLNQAHANVGTARASFVAQQATYEQARVDLARLEGLLEIDAISQQAHDRAITNLKTAEAGVEQARANLASAEAMVRSAEARLSASRLDLNRTIVRSPITGKSGISSVTKGALVASGQPTPLITVSRLDPVYVDINQSSAELLKLKQQLATGEAGQGSTEVHLILEDGTHYPLTGQIALANAQVNESTGMMTLRAVFANPDGILLPGMFVNASISQAVAPKATLLPQSAVTRTPKGESQVYVVNEQNKIEPRLIKTSGTFDGQWVVTDGLKTGDRVVVLGATKVKPDQQVEVRVLAPTASSDKQNTPNGEPINSPQAKQAPLGQNSVLARPQPNKKTEQATQAPSPKQNTAQNSPTALEQEMMDAADNSQ